MGGERGSRSNCSAEQTTTSLIFSAYFARTFPTLRLASACPLVLPDGLFLHRQLFNQIFAHSVAGAGFVANSNQSVARHFHFRFDDVLFPIALGGGNIP